MGKETAVMDPLPTRNTVTGSESSLSSHSSSTVVRVAPTALTELSRRTGPACGVTTIIDRKKLVARVTIEGTARDLYEGSQLPKGYNGGYSPSDKGTN